MKLTAPVKPPILVKAICPFCDCRTDRDLLFEHIKFTCKAPHKSKPNMSLDPKDFQVQAQTEPQPTPGNEPTKRFITTWEQIPTEEPTHRLDDNNTQ